jgi:hypothetical protein
VGSLLAGSGRRGTVNEVAIESSLQTAQLEKFLGLKKKQRGKVGQHREAVATTAPGREKSRGCHGEVVVVVASLSRSSNRLCLRGSQEEEEKEKKEKGNRGWLGHENGPHRAGLSKEKQAVNFEKDEMGCMRKK